MKKKIIIILIAIALVISLGGIYLNTVVLPTRLRLFIIQRLEEQTNKKVSLGSLRLNIFKGLVLNNLVIYDDKETFLKLEEADCGFLILPFFKKRIVIPSVRLKSLTIFLERRADKKLNISELFPSGQDIKTKAQSQNYTIFIYRISIVDSRLEFKDKSLSSEFAKTINNLNLTLRLSPSADIKFNLKANLLDAAGTKLSATGIYKIIEKQIQARVSLSNLALKDFLLYYPQGGLSSQAGLVDAFLDLNLKNDIFTVILDAKSKYLELSKDNLEAKIDSKLMLHAEHNLKDGQIKFYGTSDIKKLDVRGVEIIQNIDNIQGRINFDNSGIAAEKLTASILEVPVVINLKISGFKEPLLDATIASQKVALIQLNEILKNKFKFILPAQLKGEAAVLIKIESSLPIAQPLAISGYIELEGAALKLESLQSALENISGRIIFSPDLLKWSDLSFRYLGIEYKTKGSLVDFQAPQVAWELSSKELRLESGFAIKNRILGLSKFDGRYLNSSFSLQGKIDLRDSFSWPADLNASLKIKLEDLSGPLHKFKDTWEKIKPAGVINSDVKLKGDIKDIKSCLIRADLSSPALSIYGLKGRNFTAKYLQENSIIEMPLLNLDLYDGTMQGSLKMNLALQDLPYLINMKLSDIKLERLKLDTPLKDKDVAGIIQGEAKINGLFDHLNALKGEGAIEISDGKLWELNLLQGLGKVIFSRDFTNIVFRKGSCQFIIENQAISSDNINMQSDYVNLEGSVKIGFDGSLDTSLQVHVEEDKFPLTGTFKDITTAIIGQAGKFGTIKITGSLKEPKYKFKTSTVDIIRSLKDRLLGK